MRQAQQPFDGKAAPAGVALVLQEEFTSGVGNSTVGPGTQNLPARCVAWTPAGVVGTPVRWLDVNAQRAALVGVLPDGTDQQWCGSMIRMPDPLTYLGPIVVPPPEEETHSWAWLQLYAQIGCGPGTVQGDAFPSEARDQFSGVVISGNDLIATPGAAFQAIGLRQQSSPDDDIFWSAAAFMGEWADPESTPSALSTIPIGVNGALFRLDIFVEREVEDTGIPEYTTTMRGSVSVDDGRSWTSYGELILKGAAGYPVVVGFGATGVAEGEPLMNAIEPTLGLDFIRIFQVPAGEDTDIAADAMTSPVGGRNW